MRNLLASLSLVAVATGCASTETSTDDNPFLQDMADDSKADSAYMNPDGIEVEVDLEGDVVATSSRIDEGPIAIGQYAMSYFRKQEKMYIESLAEDGTAADRAEWLVNGTWYAANDVPTGATKKHWRLRGLNTVLLFEHARVQEGATFTAKVP